MALRVLLADESSTIKKVISLSLHDYGVEVKAVPVGIDVMAVAESFQPDLFLVDILLPKKSGYDVCKELKTSAMFANTPVIMMWSGFMDIDEAKLKDCKPDAKIEKPFDSDTLRQMVQNLVPKTQSNPVSAFLQFPKLPEIKEAAPAVPAMPQMPPMPPPPPRAPAHQPPPPPPSGGEFNGDDFTHSLVGQAPAYNGQPPASSEDVWSQFDLPAAPKVGPAAEDDFLNIPDLPEDDFKIKSINSSDNFEEIHFETNPPAAPMPAATSATKSTAQPTTPAAAPASQLNSMHGGLTPQEMTERIIREEAKIIIEKICWEILPSIAERVIKDEINKLLKETERSI